MDDREWLGLLKVGDSVIISSSGLSSGDSLGVVVRLTKNFIIATRNSNNSYELKFRKESGCETGEGYHRAWLREATKERIDALKLDYLRRKVKNFFTDKFDWDKLPLEVLTQLKEIGEKYLKEDKVTL